MVNGCEQSDTDVNRNAFELTDVYAERCRYFEEKFLGAALRDTIRANNAAADAELSAISFAFPEHRWLFCIVIEYAERGKRTLAYAELLHLNRIARTPFADYGHPMPPLRRLWLAEIVESGLSVWADRVARLAAVRLLESSMNTELTKAMTEATCPT